MDLFFYREPEEPKEQEGDEVVAAPDYGITDYQATALGGLGGGDWGAPITDAPQWGADVPAVAPIPAVPGSNWGDAGSIYYYFFFACYYLLYYDNLFR